MGKKMERERSCGTSAGRCFFFGAQLTFFWGSIYNEEETESFIYAAVFVSSSCFPNH